VWVEKTHIEGIDYLRAVMSLFVVLWHSGGFGKHHEDMFEWAGVGVSLTDIANLHVLLLAVPTFFFVSFYLYARAPKSWQGLKSRLARFARLYVFWVLVYVYVMLGPEKLISLYEFASAGVLEAFFVLISGGLVSTVYYFFASLFVLIFVAHVCHSAPLVVSFAGLVGSMLLMSSLPLVAEATNNLIFSVYWSPLNFLPYVFLGILFFRSQTFITRHRRVLLLSATIMYGVMSVVEWAYLTGPVHLNAQGVAAPFYMRSSLVFGVFILSVLVLTYNVRSNRLVKFMSK